MPLRQWLVLFTLLHVGLAVLNVATVRWPASSPPAAVRDSAQMALAGPGAGMAVRECLEHVAIIHDVHWAAACMGNVPDDSAECSLPDERAAPLNLARAKADERCVKDANNGAVRPFQESDPSTKASQKLAY